VITLIPILRTGGAAQELAADALKLLADEQLGLIEADHFPHQTKKLALYAP
jgi:hypothetical protein